METGDIISAQTGHVCHEHTLKHGSLVMAPPTQPSGKVQSQQTGKVPRRARRTRAQIDEDLKASGLPVGSRPTAAAVRQSRLEAQRARSASIATTAKATRDSPTLDLVDYQTIISYLSKPNIRNSLFGGGSQTRVSGQPMNPRSLLNPLAIKLNNNYNIRHDTTTMRLNGRILYQRLKQYKSKYASAKAFSLKTGSGLSAKNVADGIKTMDDLLESMCPLYSDMDALFRDKGNITPFGILDSGVGPPSSDDDGREGERGDDNTNSDTTDGHDHSVVSRPHHPIVEAADPGPQSPEPSRGQTASNVLTQHYRNFLDDDLISPPPTPKDPADNIPEVLPSANPANGSLAPIAADDLGISPLLDDHHLAATTRVSKTLKRKPAKGLAGLTPEELALDASLDDDALPTTAATARDIGDSSRPTQRKAAKRVSAVKRVAGLTPEEMALDDSSEDDTVCKPSGSASQLRGSSRTTLSRRSLNPLPSIDPSTVHSKEHKHALAHALQQGNEAKIQMLAESNKWRQEFEAERMRVESESRISSLKWDKERYFLDREEQREARARQLAQDSQKERQAFCQRLVMEGKSPQELEAFLRLIYPEEHL